MGEALRPGDVLVYTPREHHCREGKAFVRDDGRAVDTFWAPTGDGQSHVLTEDEVATAEVRDVTVGRAIQRAVWALAQDVPTGGEQDG